MATESAQIIEAAINESIKLQEGYDEADVVVDWVVVAYVYNPESDSDAYPAFFTNGGVPIYRARGLLNTALINLELE